ncbi:hypothetical protein DN402_01335 [Streptomyces sp. SW4]|nr:hypothetical protein DN402_01335 [Streptomyces sp. SW4]
MLRPALMALTPVTLALTSGCGSDDSQHEKAREDIRASVELIRYAREDETEGVKAGDAREDTETLVQIAQDELEDLRSAAARSQGDTRKFADTAVEWAEVLVHSRQIILDGTGTDQEGAVLMLRTDQLEDHMDEQAEDLGVEPWHPREN